MELAPLSLEHNCGKPQKTHCHITRQKIIVTYFEAMLKLDVQLFSPCFQAGPSKPFMSWRKWFQVKLACNSPPWVSSVTTEKQKHRGEIIIRAFSARSSNLLLSARSIQNNWCVWGESFSYFYNCSFRFIFLNIMTFSAWLLFIYCCFYS